MEEEQLRQRRHKPKKKLRVGRVITTIILLLLVLGGVYSFIQYSSGYKLASDQEKEVASFNGDEWEKGERENILVLGVDSRGEEKSRTDTMMLVSWDKQENDIKMVSFMRDIYAEIPGYQSYKLNTAYYLDGADLLADTLRGMFDIEIHHYALIDFQNFESMVDILAPNGVEIEVEQDMSEHIGVTLTKGTHHLSGKELLGYARFRADQQGDFGRVGRQQIVLEALKDELLSVKNLKNVPKFVGATEGFIETDMTRTDKIKRVLDIAVSGKVEMDKLTLPVEGSYSFKSYSHAGSVMVIDKEKNSAALHDFLDK